MTTSITYTRGAELPPVLVAFTNDAGTPIDLTGYTCTVTIARSQTATPVLTRTGTGGTGGVTVNWAAGELDIDSGLWLGTVQARNGSNLDYVRRFTLSID